MLGYQMNDVTNPQAAVQNPVEDDGLHAPELEQHAPDQDVQEEIQPPECQEVPVLESQGKAEQPLETADGCDQKEPKQEADSQTLGEAESNGKAPDSTTEEKAKEHKSIFDLVSETLKKQEENFSNYRTYNWFKMITLGTMIAQNHEGVWSIMDGLGLDPKYYTNMLDWFRSSAYDLSAVRRTVLDYVDEHTDMYLYDGEYMILLGDGTKQSKEGRYMPGVTRLHNDSDTQSKRSSFHGISAGGISVLVTPRGCSDKNNWYTVPLSLEIMHGLGPISSWEGTTHPNANKSLEMQMHARCLEYGNHLGKGVLMIQDRASMNQYLFWENAKARENSQEVYLLTNAKRDVTAYDPPPPPTGKAGRPKKRGDSHKLAEEFETCKGKFKRIWVYIYGKKQRVKVLVRDLLWGDKWNGMLRFCLCKMEDGRKIILATDKLTMSAKDMVELYAIRFSIEEGFRVTKQELNGLGFRFWTKSNGHYSHFRSKDMPNILEECQEKADREKVLAAIKASEAFMQVNIIAQGIAVLISMDQPIGGAVQKHLPKRTYTTRKVSERDVFCYLRDGKNVLFEKYAHTSLIKLIKEHQLDKEEKWEAL